MKINLQALLNFKSVGAEKVKELTERIRENLAQSSISAAKVDKTLGRPDMNAGPGDGRRYRAQRGVTGQRGAAGRDFAGLASGANETGGFVAAYATIAANLFAVTAAFTALSKAAQTEQLAKGLDLVGARAGVSLPPVARNLQTLTDNALSYADAMRVVAQATAAGFNQGEIERLTKVARGASVALGRDMSDSMDRLVRGTIKLEPELLDEIGIMTRLDEAVRTYAQANNVAVSSLTQTERRQAFLNAVLAEGERKFGDVSKQIEANPYDKLAASLRDLGTNFLNLLNGVLSPVAKFLADMPGLAIIPLLGIIISASSKVLPNLGNAFQKVADKMTILGEKAQFSREYVKNLNAELANDTNKLRNGAEYNDLFNQVGFLDRNDIADAFNIPKEAKEQIVKIGDEMKRLRAADAVGNAEKISQLRIIQQELRESLTINQRLTEEERKQKQINKDIMIQRAMGNRLESVSFDLNRGNIFGALGTTFGGLGEDIGNVFNKIRTGSKETGDAFSRLGASFITTGRAVGAIFTSMTMWLAGLVAALAVAQYVIENWGTESQKAYRKAIKELDELNKRIKETRVQMNLMFQRDSGQFGTALDAQRNTLDEIETKLREIAILRNAANSSEGATRGKKLGGSGLLGTDIGAAELSLQDYLFAEKGVRKEIAGLAVQTIGTIQFTNKAQAESLRNRILAAKNEAEILAILKNQVDESNKITARFSDLRESVGEFGKLLDQALPKSFETTFTKVNQNVDQITNNVKKLSANADLGALSKDSIAIGEELSKLSSIDLQALKNLAAINNSDFGASATAKSMDKIVAKKKEIEAIDVEIQRIIDMRNKQDSAYLVVSQALAQNSRDRLKSELGILAAVDGIYAIQAAANTFEEDKRKLEILKKQVETQKELLSVQESLIKNNQEIAKQNRAFSITNTLGGVGSKLNAAESALATRTESLYSARQAYDLYNATLEGKKEEIRLNAVLQKQSLKEQEARAISDAQEKSGNQLSEAAARLMPAVAMFSNMAADVDTIAAAKIQALESQGKVLSNQVFLERESVKALSNGLLAQQSSLEIESKRLEAAKELFRFRQSIAGLNQQEAQEEQKRNAYRNGTTVSPLQQDSNAIAQGQLAMENLLEERDFIEKEHMAKLKLIEFEESIALLELEIRKKQNPEFAGQFDSLINDRKAITQELIDAGYLAKDLALEENMLKMKSISASIKFLQEFPPALRALQDMKISLNKNKENLSILTENPFMPEGTRGYLSSAAETAGGYDALKKSGKLAEAKKLATELAQVDIVAQGLSNTFNALETGIAGAFEGIITGSKSAKEAFADLATGVLKMIAQMIAQMIAFKIVSMFTGGFNLGGGSGSGAVHSAGSNIRPGAAGGIIGLANGGIMGRGAGGLQGVVKQPTYLVGEGRYNEAVVPLPNGRAIPVQMHGGNSATNNVQVNVNLTSNGSVQTETQGEDMSNLGALVANAVQKELIAQKMPGGILNRYGAS